MKDGDYIEVILVSGDERKTFILPNAHLEIGDIKKRGIQSITGDVVMDDITDYHQFTITAYKGYIESLNKDLK